jgi:hypothetical protein
VRVNSRAVKLFPTNSLGPGYFQTVRIDRCVAERFRLQEDPALRRWRELMYLPVSRQHLVPAHTARPAARLQCPSMSGRGLLSLSLSLSLSFSL